MTALQVIAVAAVVAVFCLLEALQLLKKIVAQQVAQVETVQQSLDAMQGTLSSIEGLLPKPEPDEDEQGE